jgi:3-(3-hydroxy-phenyl)propionate hydroxylase
VTHRPPRYQYRLPDDFDRGQRHHPVLVLGGGLVGLTLALDLEQRGVHCVLLDEDDTVAIGSRAICFAKRSLEIYGRLGLGERMLAKGVTWNTGRVFARDRELFSFNLLPEEGHQYPAFVNLQQYYVEQWLVEACGLVGVDLRWRHRVVGVENQPDRVILRVTTPDREYCLTTDWLLVCDGARSFVRESLGLPLTGRIFHERFLITDIVMRSDFPSERWFWFDPPFHPHHSVLLHKQPDEMWRIDFQLGPDSDPEYERKPERVIPRIRAMLGPDVSFELEWVSIYTFCCRRIGRLVHGRVIFAGDAAHQVSPFGARGGNGGIQDADNLAWKLAAVVKGQAEAALLDSYDAERISAADENILNSTRSTDFMTPKSEAAHVYRDAVLALAERFAFARPFINSGRLSRPAVLSNSPLNDPGSQHWPGALSPGSPAVDAPVQSDGRSEWLLRHLGGPRFCLLCFGEPTSFLPHAANTQDWLRTVVAAPGPWPRISEATLLVDSTGLAGRRYGALPGSCVLLRPDQHVVSWFRRCNPPAIAAAARHALAIPRSELANSA